MLKSLVTEVWFNYILWTKILNWFEFFAFYFFHFHIQKRFILFGIQIFPLIIILVLIDDDTHPGVLFLLVIEICENRSILVGNIYSFFEFEIWNSFLYFWLVLLLLLLSSSNRCGGSSTGRWLLRIFSSPNNWFYRAIPESFQCIYFWICDYFIFIFCQLILFLL